MKTIHNKLVRDRIPEIIASNGQKCVCRTLSQQEYLSALDVKLNEELNEYQQDKSMEELADLLEVIHAVIAARGSTYEQVEALRLAKNEKRGSFEKRIWLESVEAPHEK